MIEERLEEFGKRIMNLTYHFLAGKINKKQSLKRFKLLIKNYSVIIEKEIKSEIIKEEKI